MFGTIRKHQTWLWVVLIGLMIFGLVSWQNQLGKNGNGQQGGSGNRGSIDNKTVTDGEYLEVYTEARLKYFLSTGSWPDNGPVRQGWNQETETYKQLFLIRKLEEFNIHTPADAVAEAASKFLNQIGQGQNVPLENFVDRYLTPHNVTTADFQRYLEHTLSIEQLQSVVGAAGQLVPPAEIQSLYEQTHQELMVTPVVFTASNYLANIPEPGPALLGQFFTNEQATYRLPDQMQVNYVLFNVTNFMVDAEKQLGTNLTHDVDDEFQSIGTNWSKIASTPDEAKTKVRESVIRRQAYTNALEKAQDFNVALATATNNPLRPDTLNQIAKEKGLEVEVTKPFDKAYGPSDLHLPQDFPMASLFNLSEEDPFPGGVVRGLDGVYIIGFNKPIPSHIPPLSEIRSQVVADCRYAGAKQLALHTGQAFAETATNGMAQGKTFEAISSGAHVTALKIPPFSLSSESISNIEDDAELRVLKEATFTTEVGRVSQFVPSPDGDMGMVVYVQKRLPIDQAKMKTELPDFGAMVRRQRESEAYGAWFNKEASTSLRDTPIFHQRPPGES